MDSPGTMILMVFYRNPLECLIKREPEGKLAFLSVWSCLYGSFLYVGLLDIGYLWGITHNKLQFVVYWLMSIVNMVQDKTEEKRIFL